MKQKPSKFLLTLLTGVLLSCAGCVSSVPTATFNPGAIYQVPPEGAWMNDLVDDATKRRTGTIWVPPGTLLVYDSGEVN